MQLIKSLIALVIITLINYLFFSFIIYNWNPAEWDRVTRGVLVWLSFAFSSAAIGIILSKDDL